MYEKEFSSNDYSKIKKNERPNQNYHQNRNTPTQQVIRGKYNAERNYRSNENSHYHNKKTKGRPRYIQPTSARFQTSEQQHNI